MTKQFLVPNVNNSQAPHLLEVRDDKLVDVNSEWTPPRHRYGEFLRKLKSQARDFEKWFLTVCSASEFLDLKNASPVVEGGRVVALEFYPEGDYDNPYEPSAKDYERLGLDPEDLGCVEPHPEGSDRGGYVPTLTNGCFWMENAGEWQG